MTTHTDPSTEPFSTDEWLSPDCTSGIRVDWYDDHSILTVQEGSDEWPEKVAHGNVWSRWSEIREEWRNALLSVGCDHETDGVWSGCTEDNVDERHEGRDYPPA